MRPKPRVLSAYCATVIAMAFCNVAAIAQSTRPAAPGATGAASAAANNSKFLRFVPDDRDGGALQTSVVTYRNAAGVTVDLIGAVHIADRRFFRDLDRSFEQYDALLYEMVKPKDAVPLAPGAARDRPAGGMAWVGILQTFLSQTLQLSFQLDEIDYTRANFVHADLDVDTFFRMQADRGESIFTLMLQQILREMTREQPRGYQPGLGDLLLALQAPDSARQIKLILARQFNEIDDLMAGLDGGPNGSVILTERNKAALKVLEQRLAQGDRKIGIFYGAAHLKGMEKTLTGQMGFTQVGEPKWLTAWDLTATRSATRPATATATRPGVGG